MNTLKTVASKAASQHHPHRTFWEPHLGDLKSRSIRTHSDCVAAGKPRDGALHQLRIDARHVCKCAILDCKNKRTVLDCKKHLMCDSSNILSKCINRHDQKNFWAIKKKSFTYNDANINIFVRSNYTQESETLAANFVVKTNDSANLPSLEKIIDMYQRCILNGYITKLYFLKIKYKMLFV